MNPSGSQPILERGWVPSGSRGIPSTKAGRAPMYGIPAPVVVRRFRASWLTLSDDFVGECPTCRIRPARQPLRPGVERAASIERVSVAGDSTTRSDDGASSAAGGWMVCTPGMRGTLRTRTRVTLADTSATVEALCPPPNGCGRQYSGHSLRAGHATSAAIAGASERSIMNQTGHRSVQMVRRYIRDGSLFRENSAGRLGH